MRWIDVILNQIVAPGRLHTLIIASPWLPPTSIRVASRSPLANRPLTE